MSSRAVSRWARNVETHVRTLGRKSMPPGGAAYTGTNLEFLNTAAPDIRRLARDLDRDLPGEWRLCAQELWHRPIFDVRNLAIELAVRHKKEFVKSDWKLFKLWLDVSVGWAMIDHLACDLFAAMLDPYPDLAQRTRVWSKSRNLWLRRASLATFCRPALKGKFPEIAFENLTRLKDDPHPMVFKAVSWLLRNSIKSNRRQVEAFLRKYEAVLAKQALREVRTKLKTGKKNPNR